MIHENVLPAKYQTLITREINSILRGINRSTQASEDKNREESKQLQSQNGAESERTWPSLSRSSDVERVSEMGSLSRKTSLNEISEGSETAFVRGNHS
jgi:hypothetical protein